MGKGKGKAGAYEDPHDHSSRPLASLKDPEAFGPPPKNVRYHGCPAEPDNADRSGLGAISQLGSLRAKPQEAPSPPPVPFRADRTGLDTATPPKPPTYRPSKEVTPNLHGSSARTKPKPSLPPRLPPRHDSGVAQGVPVPEPPSRNAALQPQSILNQPALNRLGSAGVSVPGLGIGRPSDVENPWQDQPSSMTNRPSSSNFDRSEGANELQSRFAKLSTVTTPPGSPSQSTTFAEKQAALKTGNAFQNNPSSITLADGKNAVLTANNIRERHGGQVVVGWQSASGLNQKYGIANKTSSLAPDPAGPFGPSTSSPPAAPGTSASLGPQVKNPPPPPPKRIVGLSSSGAQAPPIPQGTKPRF